MWFTYVTRVRNRSSPPTVLLRKSWREGGKVKTRTLANLTDWPDAKVEALRRVLRGETMIVAAERVEIERALPHGHVVATLGMVRRLGLDRLLPRRPERLAELALALIAARVVEPAAKLSKARQLSGATASHSLGALLGLEEVDEGELYRALDALGEAQPAIQRALARRHLEGGTLVLYDVTSSYLEGRSCELARFGYTGPRDGRPDRPQIVFGLLCAADGCPVAVEVFEGYTGDPKTLAVHIAKLKGRFRLKRVVLVGDRGMITQARIEVELKPAGLDWITALRAPAIRTLAADADPWRRSRFLRNVKRKRRPDLRPSRPGKGRPAAVPVLSRPLAVTLPGPRSGCVRRAFPQHRRRRAARVLESWKIPAGGTKERLRALQAVLESDRRAAELHREIAHRLAALTDDPAALEAFVETAGKGTTPQAVHEYLINALLSSPSTHIVNSGSNASVLAQQIYERCTAAQISALRAAGGGVEPGEAAAMFHAVIASLRDAPRLGWQSLRSGVPADQLGKVEAREGAIAARTFGLGDGALGRAVDFLGTALRLPSRLLMSEDQVFKALNRRAELHAQAVRPAAGEGLEGEAFDKRVAELLAPRRPSTCASPATTRRCTAPSHQDQGRSRSGAQGRRRRPVRRVRRAGVDGQHDLPGEDDADLHPRRRPATTW